MDLRKIKKLIDLLEESNLAEIEIKEGEESVRLSRAPVAGYAAPVAAPVYAAPAAPAAQAMPMQPEPVHRSRMRAGSAGSHGEKWRSISSAIGERGTSTRSSTMNGSPQNQASPSR